MVAKVLKPNVQDLQKDVVELLEKISKLMYQASSVLVAEGVENKYTQYQQQISDEANKCNPFQTAVIVYRK